MNLRQTIKGIYILTLIELGLFSAVTCEAILKRGTAGIIIAVGGIIIFVIGYIGSVYGIYNWKMLKETKSILAMLSTIISIFMCFFMIGCYIIGNLL